MKRQVKFQLRVSKHRVNQHARAWAIYNPIGVRFANHISNSQLPDEIKRVAFERSGFMLMRIGAYAA